MIGAILGGVAAVVLVGVWIFFDGLFLFNLPPEKKKDRKFKDKKIRRIDWGEKK